MAVAVPLWARDSPTIHILMVVRIIDHHSFSSQKSSTMTEGRPLTLYCTPSQSVVFEMISQILMQFGYQRKQFTHLSKKTAH